MVRLAKQQEVSLSTSTGPHLVVMHRDLQPATGNVKQWIKNQNQWIKNQNQEMGKDLARPYGPDTQGGNILYLKNHPAIQAAMKTRIWYQKW